jgi:uncharacterized membrane protein HdeD (DUF308 family)
MVLSVVGMALGLAPVIWGVVTLTAGETGKGLLFLIIGLGVVIGGAVNIINSRREKRAQCSS